MFKSKSVINLITLSIALTLSHPQYSLAQTLNKYCNTRYGFCVNYPSYLSPDIPPQNGDGQKFFIKKGLTMTVSGSNNVLNYSLHQIMTSQKTELDRITYQHQSKNYFILSGYKQNQIIYIKIYIGSGSINSLHLNYPLQLKTKYDRIITKISQSFQPGNLEESH
jgi:hypothetical protein